LAGIERPANSSRSRLAWAKGSWLPVRAAIRRTPGLSGALDHAQLLVFRDYACAALGAVVVGPTQPQRPEHGGQILLAVADELGLMARTAIDLLAAMPLVQRQKLLQQ